MDVITFLRFLKNVFHKNAFYNFFIVAMNLFFLSMTDATPAVFVPQICRFAPLCVLSAFILFCRIYIVSFVYIVYTSVTLVSVTVFYMHNPVSSELTANR